MSRPTSSSTKGVGGAPSSSNGAMSAREVYDVTGDAGAALRLLSSSSSSSSTTSSSPAEAYNRCLLKAMSSTENSSEEWWKKLPFLEDSILKSTTTSRKRRRNEWTLTYNRSLVLVAQGQAETAAAAVWKLLAPSVTEDKALSQELLPIACRMALLLLESILTLSVGNPLGISPEWKWKDPAGSSSSGEDSNDESATTDFLPILNLETLLFWFPKRIDSVSPSTSSEQHTLKFALHLYTARRELLERSHGKLVETRIRSARKDLKQAMEIFQNKLKPSDGGGSMASSSVVSGTGNSAITGGGGGGSHSNDPSSLPPMLQRQNQAALSLKANTEQLKGNIKKSLILCSEAQASTTFENNSDCHYDAIHYNNLGIAYETHGKLHLALHSWSKAVACATSSSSSKTTLLESDGTARLDVKCNILWNAALGSLQARNFLAAYECLGTCLEHSSIWRSKDRAWLRLGEACIGIWSNLQQQRVECQQGQGVLVGGTAGSASFSIIDIEGEPKGIVLDKTAGDPKDIGDLANVLASPQDLEQLQINPLPRARVAFEHVIDLITPSDDKLAATEQGIMTLQSAQISLAYICLETKDYTAALQYADAVLGHEVPPEVDSARKALFDRQQATARMYASEASCILGDAIASMKYLVGDGKNDAFDRLATALSGGVTIETAASLAGAQGKTRLAKAQAMVRCSASAASACMGNLPAAKQLAMSAQAMSREGSYATRALIYCMLREGNRGAALTLLRSAR